MPAQSTVIIDPESLHASAHSTCQILLRPALLAFIAGLPFSFGSFGLFLYYWGFLLLFTALGHYSLRRSINGFYKQLYQAHPIICVILVLWLLSSSISLVQLWFDDKATQWQLITSFARYSYDLTMLAFAIVVAKLQVKRLITITEIFVALSIGLMLMIIFHIMVYNTVSIPSDIWFASPPLGPHIRDQGNLACVVVVSMSALLIASQKMALKSLLLCSMALLMAFAFIFWTGGRMAAVASMITAVCIFVAVFRSQLTRSLFMLTVFSGVVVTAWLLADQFSVYPWNGISRLLPSVGAVSESHIVGDMNINQLSTGRWHMWAMSIKATLKQPWFGLGPYGYFFIPERTYDDQPHNFIIQFFVEWGVIGALLMLVLLAICCLRIIALLPEKVRNGDTSYLVASAVILVLTLHGLTGGTYFKIQPFTCLVLAFSRVLADVYGFDARNVVRK